MSKMKHCFWTIANDLNSLSNIKVFTLISNKFCTIFILFTFQDSCRKTEQKPMQI